MNQWMVLGLGFALICFSYGCGKKEELQAPARESLEMSAESSSDQAAPEGAMKAEEGTSEDAPKGGETGDKVNINTADAATLSSIDGIGEKMADAIVTYREEKGKFTSVEDIKGHVKGIGGKTFDKIKDYLTIEGGISHGVVEGGKSGGKSEGKSHKHKSGHKSEGGKGKFSKKEPPAGKININTASSEELQTIPGIGEKTADQIIAYRKEHGGFKSIEDIRKIKGISEKKFDKVKEYLTVK